MLDNSDGLFDNLNPKLFNNKKARRMNLTSFGPEEKMNIRLAKKQLQIAKYQAEVDALNQQIKEEA